MTLYCVCKLAVLGSTECISKVFAIVDEDFGVCLSSSSDACYHYGLFYLAPFVTCGLFACVLNRFPRSPNLASVCFDTSRGFYTFAFS